ncbi:MAG TPA: tetratricopeptide repeat protein, partial [Candidatus Nitrosotenuis sp.]|nr:tetratricopeptide repeat protein [Candidatus Nitrosotenuis sp.]
MAYNKIKHIEAAQKFLSQGKLAQAINEYEKILNVEPNDQVTLMTVGDLHVRSGDTNKAIECFERLAQSFLQDGFTSKAIAIYKKIAKLSPEATTPLEKLAELYVQQGVMNEARSLYLQLAETHLRAGRQNKAVEILRLMLDLEPENLRVQLRLAELYTSIGQKSEAAHAYLNCAHRMFDHSQFGEALRYVEQAIKADATNVRAVTLKGRLLAATGKLDDAISLLEKLADSSAGGDTTKLLLGFYLQAQRTDAALALARKAFSTNKGQYGVVYDLALQLLDGGDAEKAFELIGEIRAAMVEAQEFDKLSQVLSTLSERMAGKLEPLEWLVDVCRQSNDSFRLPDALDQLADAVTAAGQLDRAQQIFKELVEKDPENENFRRKLNQVRARLGLETLIEEAPAPKVAPTEVSAQAAPVEEVAMDEDTQRFVSQTMTDVDLFSSYGMTQKAIDLLESAVERVPTHVGMLEKLLDMHLGASNERRTAELAERLEKICSERGDSARAEKFAELRRRFDRAARLTEEAPVAAAAAPEFSLTPAPVPEPEVAAEAPAPAEEAAVHEVDLSAEWASLSQLTPETPAEVAPPPAEAPVEEEVLELPLEAPPAEQTAEAVAPQTEEVVEYELELAPVTPPASAPEPAPEPVAPAARTTDSFLSELAAEVDGLELGPAAPAPAAAATTAVPKPTPVAGEAVEQLKEVFDEFRSELGQMGEEETEDLETHYNLGIAYREMGLVEEAIGEFQKVAQAVQKGRPFRYAMQC